MKVKNDVKVSLGKEVKLFFPYKYLSVIDEDHNRLNSREELFENRCEATVFKKNNSMFIKLPNRTLVYEDDPNIAEGQYDIVFKQDKLLPIFNKKMLKTGLENPEMDNSKNTIKVSAYDEDVLGSKILVYVAVPFFENYSSFVLKNNFSVYKMPKFELYVPRDGFVLIPKE